jgi:hypothetical protein
MGDGLLAAPKHSNSTFIMCNNLILNEIRVLKASYVCLHALSLRQQSPDPDSGRWTLHF